jgi:predicted GH43/DUF377 family glycosyl hydrolase
LSFSFYHKGGSKEVQTDSRRLVIRHPGNPILDVSMWPYAINSVFNPAAARVDGETLLFVRAEDCRGISHLTAARSSDGVSNWRIDAEPTLASDITHPEEVWGIEDARITMLEELGEWAITYTAYSKGGPLVSLACTDNFRSFRRLGPIMSPENKDAALFPRRFKGKWAMIHRPCTAFMQGKADMWLSLSPDLKHWGDHRMLMAAREGAWWDGNKIGLGPPPLETEEGWLILYHGVKQTAAGYTYRLGLALLDLEDPARVISRSDSWVFGPEEPYERMGDVANVVFPCGWILDKEGAVRIYYGASDTVTCLATVQLQDLLGFLKHGPALGLEKPPAQGEV